MSGEISFEKAELLFDIGEYEKSFDMITALVEQPDVQEPYKLWTLAAKSYLYLIKALSDEDRKAFEKGACTAFRSAQSVEEEIWVEYQLMSAVADWAPKALDYALELILRESTIDNRSRVKGNFILDSYNLYSMVCENGFCVMLHSPVDAVVAPRIAEITNEERQELRMKICGVSECPRVDVDALQEKVLDTTELLCGKMHHIITENAHGSMEYVNQVLDVVIELVLCIRYILEMVRPNEEFEKNNPTLALKSYQTELQFLFYILEAKVYPNGKAYSVINVQDYRDSMFNNWRTLSAAMQRLDPNYTPVQPTRNLVNDYSNSNSGGCYVATAVYGSYDCPEVWTLRRSCIYPYLLCHQPHAGQVVWSYHLVQKYVAWQAE